MHSLVPIGTSLDRLQCFAYPKTGSVEGLGIIEAVHAGHPPQQVAASVHVARQDLLILGALSLTRSAVSVNFSSFHFGGNDTLISHPTEEECCFCQFG